MEWNKGLRKRKSLRNSLEKLSDGAIQFRNDVILSLSLGGPILGCDAPHLISSHLVGYHHHRSSFDRHDHRFLLVLFQVEKPALRKQTKITIPIETTDNRPPPVSIT